MMTNSRLMSAGRVLEHLIGYNSLHTQERKLEQLQYCHSSTIVTKLSKHKVITNILFSSMQANCVLFHYRRKMHKAKALQNFTTCTSQTLGTTKLYNHLAYSQEQALELPCSSGTP